MLMFDSEQHQLLLLLICAEMCALDGYPYICLPPSASIHPIKQKLYQLFRRQQKL